MVAYENSSEEFNIGHCLIKVKVMAQLKICSPFTTIQLFSPISLFGTGQEIVIKYACSI